MTHLFFAKRLCFFTSLIAFSISLSAQTNLSGVINSYDVVTAYSVANNAMTVSTPAMWAASDRVVVIQMNGATINTTNTSSYGTISNYNHAGNYELATICEVNGSMVVFDNILRNSYSPNLGTVQLVKVALISGNAVIQDTVRAQAWDGIKGGVVAIEASGKVTIDRPIIVDGQGFRGGAYQNSTNNSCKSIFFNNPNDYFYNSADDAGRKGEGVATVPANQLYGKGPAGSGGGGGNDHNTGGGGGGYTFAGGQGGNHQNTAFGCSGAHPGLGGLGLSFFVKGFLGSGGGAGHGNNLGGGGGGTGGGNGGGIVIIKANDIEGGLQPLISSEGENVTVDAQADGAGGGGSGGMVHLQALTVTGSLVVQTRGGAGGSVNNQNLVNGRCFGPGGGGSGGTIKIGSGTVAGASFFNGGGVAGTSFNSSGNCSGGSLGAAAGGGGAILFGTNIQNSILDFLTCAILPVSWLSFEGEKAGSFNELSWQIESTALVHSTNIMRQNRIGQFVVLDSIDAQARNWVDLEPLQGVNRYQIKVLDMNGKESLSPVVELIQAVPFDITVLGQPIAKPANIIIEAFSQQADYLEITISDIHGRTILEREANLEEGSNRITIPSGKLAPGRYFLRAKNASFRKVVPISVF
ncbi:MAG: hypothetical protein AB8F95_10165 [Bacteroidia bacterium]